MGFRNKGIGRIIEWVVMVALLVTGVWLEQGSFKWLREMRQLQRLARTEVQAALPGEIHLSGRLELAGEGVRAPKSGVTCVYCRYQKQVRSRDSDGVSEWKIVESDEQASEFQLRDETGRILVIPGPSVDFSFDENWAYISHEGRFRFIEWRIKPGDFVNVFGHAEPGGEGLEVRFESKGDYTPLISTFEVSDEQTEKATAAPQAEQFASDGTINREWNKQQQNAPEIFLSGT